MSSLDRWLTPFTHVDKVATIATSATLVGRPQKSGISRVATIMRPSATPSKEKQNVALSCNLPATTKAAGNSASKGNVAKVAEVAGVDSQIQTAWDSDDWWAYYDERAAIAEHDGGMFREKAERMAFDSCIAHWLNKTPSAHNDPNTCPQCNKPINLRGTDAIAALTGNGGHLWLHDKCHSPWCARRKQQAISALADMGIIVKECN